MTQGETKLVRNEVHRARHAWPPRADLDPGSLIVDQAGGSSGPSSSSAMGELRAVWAARQRWLGPLAIAVLAVGLRLAWFRRSYDIFGDEVDYTDLSQSVRSGHFPAVFGGHEFLLHPPLFFLLGGVWLRIFDVSGSYFDVLYSMRLLNIVLGSASAILLYLIGHRVGGRYAGLAAGLLFALDPYVMRQNGRVLLETSTLAFILAGWLVLLPLFHNEPHRSLTTQTQTRTAVVGGLLLGFGILAKDMSAFLVVIPLAVAIFCRWGAGRKYSALALATAVVPYAVYLIVLLSAGAFGNFLSQNTTGLRRLLGSSQQTGFNRSGSPSLLHTLIRQLGEFGPTYLGCGLGCLAALWLLSIKRDDVRILAWITLAGALTLGYGVAFGTIEEQFFYFLFVPSLLSLSVAGVLILGRVGRSKWRTLACICLVAISLYDAGSWWYIRSTPDNGLQRMTAWFSENVPRTDTVAHIDASSAYMLQRDGFSHQIYAGDAAYMAANHVEYLVVEESVVDGNYEMVGSGGMPYIDGEKTLTKAEIASFAANGTVVFDFADHTFGHVVVYRTNDSSVW